MTTREEIVARARGCVGARFRAHGRGIEFGLDCVGVAAIAFRLEVPADYPLRSGDRERTAARIEATGLVPIDPAGAAAGDLLLIEAGPGQLHLAVLTERGFVHADVGLRRVVETPGRPAGPIIGAWAEED